MKFCYLALVLCLALADAKIIKNQLASCDPSIISAIQTFWESKSVPNDILATLDKLGTGKLVASTVNLPFAEIPTNEPDCVIGKFTPSSATFTFYNNGANTESTRSANKAGQFSYDENENGGIVNEEGVTRYVITNDFGITTFYACDPSSNIQSISPAGGIATALKVLKNQVSLNEINIAQGLMKLLGIYTNVKYESATCNSIK